MYSDLIIAIDGPASSGKSTTARLVAEKVGFLYLDTGAMYRAVTYAFLQLGLPVSEDGAERLFEEVDFRVEQGEDGTHVFLNGSDVSGQLRSSAVSNLVSAVSALRTVRRHMVAEQRRLAAAHGWRGLVADGRDIGTVVLPDADVKIFMVADPKERARRRHAELVRQGESVKIEDVLSEIQKRDERDVKRSVSPLRRADDAIDVDTTRMSIDEQVEFVAKLARERSNSSTV